MNHELMTVEEVSDYLRTPKGTLAQWRYNGRGPKSFKLGGKRVLYKRDDVEAFLRTAQNA